MDQYTDTKFTPEQSLEADRIALEQSKVDLEKTNSEQRTVIQVAWSIVALIGVIVVPFIRAPPPQS